MIASFEDFHCPFYIKYKNQEISMSMKFCWKANSILQILFCWKANSILLKGRFYNVKRQILYSTAERQIL